ncbi:MAG: hypothetical protein PHP99_12935 [Paludibacter sp.]|nr:hypothetical protein [Paludibacter sp.]
MIIYGKKNIHKWKYWQTKSKIVFCLVSGLVYTGFVFVGNLIIKPLFGHSDELILNSAYIAIGTFIPASFLSIALWYENERRYNVWKNENEAKND